MNRIRLFFLLAAFLWLLPAQAALPTLQESVAVEMSPVASTWELVDVQPVGFTEEGIPLALFIYAERSSFFDELAPVATRAGPQTHTRVLCYVQPVLGLAIYGFDGTWQHRGHPDQVPSNVALFLDAYAVPVPNGVRDVFYYGGIGNAVDHQWKAYQKYAGGTGAGGHDRLEQAYDDLVRNWNLGDRQIDVVGFSRGASLAIAFPNLVNKRGIPDLSSRRIKKERKLVSGAGGRKRWETVESVVFDRYLAAPGNVDVNFVGVWDAVGSFGLARDVLWIPFQQIDLGYDLSTPTHANHVAHALALDEKRESFFPRRLSGANEMWFSGVHGQVGGGGPKGSLNYLSDITLEWMFTEAEKSGVIIDRSKIRPLNLNLQTSEWISPDNSTLLFGEKRRRVYPTDKIHPSVNRSAYPWLPNP